jgi:hypothetical protein
VRAPIGIVLAVVAAAGLLATGVAVGQEPPERLWEEFPLVPTEPINALPVPQQPPGGVAGVQVGGIRPPGSAAGAALATDDPLGAVPVGLLLTGTVSAILLLGAASLPRAPARGPALLGLVAERRLELTLAGAAILLVTTLVYLAVGL